MLRGFVVFLAVAVSDVCWVRCVTASARSQRWSASSWAVAQTALMSLGVIEYTRDHWMLVPALLGAFVGTALGVRKQEAPHGERV